MNWPTIVYVAISFACAVYVWLHATRQQTPVQAPQPCTHETLVIIAAQPLVYLPTSIMTPHPAQTVVLRRCMNCGEHRSDLYMGHWTAADLIRTTSEISALERLLQ